MRLRYLAVLFCFAAASTHAGLFDFLKRVSTNTLSGGASTNLANLSQEQVTQALKDALGKGIQGAVTNLSKPGGFLDNVQVRIPLPQKLQLVETGLRSLKQDKYADEFVATMNHAAEQAVPASLPIFTDALRAMTIDDAKRLLTGGDDSATRFFKDKGEKQIQEKMLPVIKEATAKTGVTAAYKKLVDKASAGDSFLGRLNMDMSSLDVDQYVTQKASDGLFTMIAGEEKKIRANPGARTTELLQKVFGAVSSPATNSHAKP